MWIELLKDIKNKLDRMVLDSESCDNLRIDYLDTVATELEELLEYDIPNCIDSIEERICVLEELVEEKE